MRCSALLPALWLLLFIGAALALSPAAACPDTPHRFETFSLPADGLGHKRVLVYLPAGYDCGDQRYPTFYLNDGHDLFEWDPSLAQLDPALAEEVAAREGWYGSWRLGEQLEQARVDGILPPMIVVGIASDDGFRSRDLAPVPWDGSSEARGAAFGAFVVGRLVPVVDHRYRTNARRFCRGVGGASLGAMSAMQIGLSHPKRFSMVLAFSPVLRDPALAGFLADLWRGRGATGPSVLLDLDDDPVGHADRRWLETTVGKTLDAAVIQTPNGQHALASWAERVIPALTTLVSGRCG